MPYNKCSKKHPKIKVVDGFFRKVRVQSHG